MGSICRNRTVAIVGCFLGIAALHARRARLTASRTCHSVTSGYRRLAVTRNPPPCCSSRRRKAVYRWYRSGYRRVWERTTTPSRRTRRSSRRRLRPPGRPAYTPQNCRPVRSRTPQSRGIWCLRRISVRWYIRTRACTASSSNNPCRDPVAGTCAPGTQKVPGKTDPSGLARKARRRPRSWAADNAPGRSRSCKSPLANSRGRKHSQGPRPAAAETFGDPAPGSRPATPKAQAHGRWIE